MGVLSEEKKLNKEQLEAVYHGEGPLLIIAGAGTGKTTVITERIKRLITEGLTLPSEILALTFTDKAAREMEERVDKSLPMGLPQMWINTFHAFGDKILRSEAIQIGLDPGYSLMTEAESIIFLRKNFFKFDLDYFRPLGNPNKFIGGMLNHFERLKDEDVLSQDYLAYAENLVTKLKMKNEKLKIEEEKINKTLELANAYRTYEELKMKEGVMDFADLISNTLKLFRMRRNVLKEYQEKFKYILIDEFQDTNFAQNELAILLAGGKKNITVGGDDDQAIYRWRGAAISNIIQFRKTFPATRLVILTKNYRSTQEILDRSYFMIQNNNPDRLEVKEKINKKLVSERRIEGEKIKLIYSDRVENEADEVAKEIKNQKSRYQWRDFAILVRANDHSDPFVRAFQRTGIPYQFLGPGMLFRQAEVKDLIAYLKLLDNLEDSVALFRVLSMNIWNLKPEDLYSLNIFGKKMSLSLFEALDVLHAFYTQDQDHWSKEKNYLQYLPLLSPSSKDIIMKFVSMVKRHIKLIRDETAGQILYYFLEDSGLLKTFSDFKSLKEEKVALNISRFFDKLKTFETEHDDASVHAVVDWIDMSMELGESPQASNTDWSLNDAVTILTVHSSKGLEFPVVFMTNLVSLRFPTNLRREQIPIPDELVKEILPTGDYHLEEERRLFYVGMTRARDKLYFSASNYYGEGKRERKISPFVVEVLGEEIQLAYKQISKLTNQLNLFEWKKKESIEEKSLKQPINYLSYSQIDTFNKCPLQYKYRYIVKIPTPPSAAASFGSSMHLALQRFYERRKKGEDLTQKNLLSILDEIWIPLGYGTKQYEEKMKKRGYDMLREFFEKFYDAKILPRDLEYLFKVKITPTLRVGGKIDRVDVHNGKLEIIDYKTGKKPSDAETKDNLQMTLYALAATDPGIYNKKPEEVILTFYFFNTNEKISSTRTDKQLIEAKKILQDTAKKMAESTFLPEVGSWCDFCDFKLICPAWQS